jgi:thioredoxin-related protein
MAARPVVDRIEQEHKEQLRVIRLNVQVPVGRAIGALYDFRFTPTFVLLDGQGQVLLRSVGAIDPLAVRTSLASP